MTHKSPKLSITSSDCESAGYLRLIELDRAGTIYHVYIHYNEWAGYRSEWLDANMDPIKEPNWAPREYDLDELAIAWEATSTKIYDDISPAELFKYLTSSRINTI